MRLPEQFTDYMKQLLGDEYNAFHDSYKEERHYGLRLNGLKVTDAASSDITSGRKTVPWCETGFYYDEEDRPAKDSYYYAGAYYIQEPSAMTPGTVIDAQPGEWIIDLCAAPGGKTTQIASAMAGQGLLVSNDISPGRVKNLNKNVQISGIRNAVVLSEDPVKLAKKWPQQFDKVLIDAPCSGEGMFRKEPKLVSSWESEGPDSFVPVQRLILSSAHELLKPGGELVYSTCTYNLEENEKNILWFLESCPDMELVDITGVLGVSSGFSISERHDLARTARVWPHLHEGEGHYIAKLRKRAALDDKIDAAIEEALNEQIHVFNSHHRSDDSRRRQVKLAKPSISKGYREVFLEFAGQLGWNISEWESARLNVIKDTLYMLPEHSPDTKGLRVFAAGWLLGTFKKNRFEPSQALACGLKPSELDALIDWHHDDENVLRYLKGETVNVDVPNDWYLVAVEGMSLGFGKVVNKRLKNKYEPTWRWQ